ncbi:MAG TPA: glycosyltransferase family 4 protein [Flavobacteriales bacterium]|nr:glycosyltransferase family 4 protein [Flavobacteriales bacterium]
MSRSRLKIALCTDGVFPHALGGMQRHSRLLAEHLAKRPDIELVVLHPHSVDVFDQLLGISEVRVQPLDEKRFYLGELRRYSERMAVALDRVEADVILSQGFCIWQDIDRFGHKLIVHPHGLEMFQGLTLKDKFIGAPFRALLKFVARRSAVTISLGGKITNMLNTLVAGSRSRIVVLPNAVEVPTLPPAYPAADHPLTVLFVGRFAFNKGIDVLLAVAKRLADEGNAGTFKFILAGDGPERARMEAQGLPPNAQLVGKVDDDRLRELYAQCHALLLPTRFEGMPTVVLEAMANARPAFVSDVGAAGELVSASNGYLLPPGDAQALYDALIHFSERPHSQRAQLGSTGFALARERFTWEAVTDDFVQLFREVAKAH